MAHRTVNPVAPIIDKVNKCPERVRPMMRENRWSEGWRLTLTGRWIVRKS